jgi:hypothetical protein
LLNIATLALNDSLFLGPSAKVYRLNPADADLEEPWNTPMTPFEIVASAVLIYGKYLFIPLGVIICFLETSYPIFIWPRRTRAIWLGSIIGMHAAIAVMMGLYLFGLIMVGLNVAAFGADLVRLRSKR